MKAAARFFEGRGGDISDRTTGVAVLRVNVDDLSTSDAYSLTCKVLGALNAESPAPNWGIGGAVAEKPS